MSAKEVAKRAAAQIDFFYDVASPYSWMAFETLMRYRRLGVWNNTDIRLRPFFLAGVMNATGNKPPATLKTKGLYMRRDVMRMAKHHGAPLVPLKDPRAMYDTLSAQRLLSATAMDAPGQLEGLTRELWRRLWGGGGDVATDEGLREACEGAGIDDDMARALLSRSADEDVKERLKAETEAALQRGAFGAPWITLRMHDSSKHSSGDAEDDAGEKTARWEAFFGCDRFDVLAEAMGRPWLGPRPDLSNL